MCMISFNLILWIFWEKSRKSSKNIAEKKVYRLEKSSIFNQCRRGFSLSSLKRTLSGTRKCSTKWCESNDFLWTPLNEHCLVHGNDQRNDLKQWTRGFSLNLNRDCLVHRNHQQNNFYQWIRKFSLNFLKRTLSGTWKFSTKWFESMNTGILFKLP